MRSFSICTKANYRKLLHLFPLENLKGKQLRPPCKNNVSEARGTFFPKTCSSDASYLSMMGSRPFLGFARNRFGMGAKMIVNTVPLTNPGNDGFGVLPKNTGIHTNPCTPPIYCFTCPSSELSRAS